METRISKKILRTPEGKIAEGILRSCVHCGFCNATCPTYQMLGDELDGPRGRIYLIKKMLEGKTVTQETQQHLDRCLTCRACETTCPSGVKYGKLIDIGRHFIEKKVSRSWASAVKRRMITWMLPFPKRYSWAVSLARMSRTFWPHRVKMLIPTSLQKSHTPLKQKTFARKVILAQGCAQSILASEINQATGKLLNHLGIEVISVPSEGCCGAIHHHLGHNAESFVRKNIDAWWPHIEQGVEAIISTASGCGVQLKDYAALLPDNDSYQEKAAKVAHLVQDISEWVINEDLSSVFHNNPKPKKVAFHSPCTLQHGQKKVGIVEKILTRAGFELTRVQDAHLCCGSAGTYSILQPELSKKLRHNKLSTLSSGQPEMIVTANIGCLLHMRQAANIPIKHWVELFTPPFSPD